MDRSDESEEICAKFNVKQSENVVQGTPRRVDLFGKVQGFDDFENCEGFIVPNNTQEILDNIDDCLDDEDDEGWSYRNFGCFVGSWCDPAAGQFCRALNIKRAHRSELRIKKK